MVAIADLPLRRHDRSPPPLRALPGLPAPARAPPSRAPRSLGFPEARAAHSRRRLASQRLERRAPLPPLAVSRREPLCRLHLRLPMRPRPPCAPGRAGPRLGPAAAPPVGPAGGERRRGLRLAARRLCDAKQRRRGRAGPLASGARLSAPLFIVFHLVNLAENF